MTAAHILHATLLSACYLLSSLGVHLRDIQMYKAVKGVVVDGLIISEIKHFALNRRDTKLACTEISPTVQ